MTSKELLQDKKNVALLRLLQEKPRAPIAELAQSIRQVTECHRVTGEDCFLLKMHVKDISNLDDVLDRLLFHGQTTTSIVQSTPVPLRNLPISS